MPAVPTNIADLPEIDAAALQALCKRFGVRWLALFGSVARGEANPTSDVDVWNNIVVARGSGAWLDVDLVKLSGFQSDANLFWHPGGATSRFRLAPPPSPVDLPAWRTRTGGQDQNSHRGDPLFVPDPRMNDYYTRTGSPARDAALNNTGASFCGAGPDIGFLESCQ